MVSLKKNEKGFSLVSTLMAVAIMGILATVLASMFTAQHKEMKALKQKLASGNLNQLILRVLQNSANCSCHLNAALNTVAPGPLNINTNNTTSHDMDLQIFRNGCNFSSTNNIIAQAGKEITDGAGLIINAVRVTNVRPTGTGNEYSGVLTIDYDGQSLVRALLPITVDLIFTIDPTSGIASARPIKSCAGEDVVVDCNNLGGTMTGGKCTITELKCVRERRLFHPSSSNKRVNCPPGYSVTGCAFSCNGGTTDADGSVSTSGNYCASDDTGCSGSTPQVGVSAVCCRLE